MEWIFFGNSLFTNVIIIIIYESIVESLENTALAVSIRKQANQWRRQIQMTSQPPSTGISCHPETEASANAWLSLLPMPRSLVTSKTFFQKFVIGHQERINCWVMTTDMKYRENHQLVLVNSVTITKQPHEPEVRVIESMWFHFRELLQKFIRRPVSRPSYY